MQVNMEMSAKVEFTDVEIQVVKKNGRSKEIQTDLSLLQLKSIATQCTKGEVKGSYQRREYDKNGHWTYDSLTTKVLSSKECVVSWLMEMKLIANSRLCPQCESTMKLVECNDRSDGCKWECRKQVNPKRHKVELSIRTYPKLMSVKLHSVHFRSPRVYILRYIILTSAREPFKKRSKYM